MKRIVLFGILIFVVSVGIGFYYSKLWKKENMPEAVTIENEVEKNVIKETASVDEKLSFDANFELKKYYNECGHVTVNQAEIPIEMINLTEDEIKNTYSDWRVEEFNENNLVLAQNIDSMCDEHYVLRLGDSNVEIYQMREFDDFELLKTTNISKDYLTSTDISNLEEGIFIYGTSNLNSALEDFE